MYWDLLPRIKNAEMAGKNSFLAPFSKMDHAVSEVLRDAGYVKDAQKKTTGKKHFLEIKLNPKKMIEGFKIISKLSRHVYVDSRNIRSVRNGYGLGVFSTSKGILGNKEARKQRVGGEYLFEIW